MDTTKNKTNTVNSAQTSSTNTGSVEHGSVPAESKRRGSSPNLDPETNVQRGIAGVFPSTFGGDKTTTSTFEKSQGERYGEGFDETGALLKGKFSRDDPPNNQASGSGGGENTTSASQNGKTAKDTNVPSKHSPHNGNHQEGLGHKIIDKAEEIIHKHEHKHHHDHNHAKIESRTK